MGLAVPHFRRRDGADDGLRVRVTNPQRLRIRTVRF